MVIWDSDLLIEMFQVSKEKKKSTYSTCPRSHLHLSESKTFPSLCALYCKSRALLVTHLPQHQPWDDIFKADALNQGQKEHSEK